MDFTTAYLCKNKTLVRTQKHNSNLTCEQVFEMLIDIQNSNNNKFPLDISSLVNIASTISRNVVTHVHKLNLPNVAIETVIKLYPATKMSIAS